MRLNCGLKQINHSKLAVVVRQSWLEDDFVLPFYRGNLLLVACASCGASVGCAGFGSRNTATAFRVFHWLQVTNFSLLKSAPNGVDYTYIRRRLPLHSRLMLAE